MACSEAQRAEGVNLGWGLDEVWTSEVRVRRWLVQVVAPGRCEPWKVMIDG